MSAPTNRPRVWNVTLDLKNFYGTLQSDEGVLMCTCESDDKGNTWKINGTPENAIHAPPIAVTSKEKLEIYLKALAVAASNDAMTEIEIDFVEWENECQS